MIIPAIIKQFCTDNRWRLVQVTWSKHLSEHYQVWQGKFCVCEIAIRKTAPATIIVVDSQNDPDYHYHVHQIALANPNSIAQTQKLVLKICTEAKPKHPARPLRRSFAE